MSEIIKDDEVKQAIEELSGMGSTPDVPEELLNAVREKSTPSNEILEDVEDQKEEKDIGNDEVIGSSTPRGDEPRIRTREYINHRGTIYIHGGRDEQERTYSKKQIAAAELINARDKKLPLEMVVTSVEPVSLNGQKGWGVAGFYGDWKIIIPLMQYFSPDMLNNIERFDVKALRQRANYNKRAFVDFIPIAFFPEKNSVIASRTMAMEVKKLSTWFNSKNIVRGEVRDFIEEGSIVEARVVSSSMTYVNVEVFGVEVGIPAKDVTYLKTINLKDEYKPGDTVRVVIRDIEKDEDLKTVHFKASIKDAYRDPRIDAYNCIVRNGSYLGTVTYLNTSFKDSRGNDSRPWCIVKIEGIDAEVYCNLKERIVRRGDLVDFYVVNKDEKTLRIWGDISHVHDANKGARAR